MKTRSAPFTPSKGVDKAPNGVLMNVLFLNICPPEKDQNGNPKIVKDGAPPKFMVLPLESADVMCYQGKGQSAKAKVQMQYFSPDPIRFEAFARTRKLKSFALPRNPVPGGMYKIDTLSYSRFNSPSR